MIEVVTWANAYRFGDALASQARLRYRMFIECRHIDHANFDGLEYDRFDNPAAVYLLYRDAEGEVRGMTRLLRTTRPYMLKTYWPFLVAGGALPESDEVWEGTRLCVDIRLDRAMRQRVLAEILCGTTEYLETQGARHLIAVSSRMVAMRLFRRDLEWMGDDAMVEGRMESAFRVPAHAVEQAGDREKYGFGRAILNIGDRHATRRAA